jgi:hypothetical protein
MPLFFFISFSYNCVTSKNASLALTHQQFQLAELVLLVLALALAQRPELLLKI